MTQIPEKDIIHQILEHPNARSLINKVNSILEEERKRRHQFYEDITDEEKIEFINGVIVTHSPVMKEHNDVSNLLTNLLGNYVRKHQLGYVGVEKVMITLERNDYEPDICFFCTEKAKAFKKGQSLFPAPDFVVEILSKGTKKNDRTIKFTDYEANDIKEYLIIDPIKQVLELYRLDTSKKYELVLKSGTGLFESEAINGFSFPIEAIFDEGKNFDTLSKILSA